MSVKGIAIPALSAAGSAGAGAGAAYVAGENGLGLFGSNDSDKSHKESESIAPSPENPGSKNLSPSQPKPLECTKVIFDNDPFKKIKTQILEGKPSKEDKVSTQYRDINISSACLISAIAYHKGDSTNKSWIEANIELFALYGENAGNGLYVSTQISNVNVDNTNSQKLSTKSLNVTHRIVYLKKSVNDATNQWTPESGFVFKRKPTLDTSKKIVISNSSKAESETLEQWCDDGKCTANSYSTPTPEEFKWKSSGSKPISIQLGSEELTLFGRTWDLTNDKKHVKYTYDSNNTDNPWQEINSNIKVDLPKGDLFEYTDQ